MSIVEEAPSGRHVGRVLRRKEDPRLITGRARYIDDISLPGTLWAAIIRSPEAHAKIVSIDSSAATERPGVHAVFTGEDMSDLGGPLPMAWVPPGVEVNNPEHWPLARGAVKHVGDAVAVVLGDDRYAVSDAAEDVIVEYETLPAIVDPEAALEGGPFVHEQFGTNKVHEWSLAGGDVEAGFAEADVVVQRRVVNHRIAGAPIECRGVLAEYRAGSLTLWTSTQVPHFVRLFMALLLGMTEDHVRVIAPEVGGGFGSKLQIYGEELLACWCSRKLGRPVKWIETRSENMSVTHQGRDQIAQVKMGAKRDGTITAFHVKIIADFGAYNMILTPLIPSLGAFVMGGCYKIPNVQTDITGVFTNKCPTDAIRGAGRPEATHMIEVTLDQLAHELGMDRLEIRRKNFIPKEDFPAAVAGQADGARRRGGVQPRAGEAASQGRVPGNRVLHLHRDLRPGPVPGYRPGGGRRAGGSVGVGDDPRSQHRGGDRLHRHLTPRAGAGYGDGADRRRQARRRPVDRGSGPRRHRHRPRGPRDLRLALAGHRRRGSGQGDRQGRQ
jgi:carbon-monoxide dehydrogenase large subunit